MTFANWARATLEYLKHSAAFLAIASTLIGVLWFFAANEVQDGARELVGFKQIETSLMEQNVKIDDIYNKVDSVETRVEALEPPRRVSEYDELRSKIFSPCEIGKPCVYTFRVRRTQEGLSCSVPKSTRVLVDSTGLTFYPDPAPTAHEPTRINGEWTIIHSAFIIPDIGVATGIAEFYLHLEYHRCDGMPVGETLTELSTPLVFTIVHAADENP